MRKARTFREQATKPDIKTLIARMSLGLCLAVGLVVPRAARSQDVLSHLDEPLSIEVLLSEDLGQHRDVSRLRTKIELELLKADIRFSWYEDGDYQSAIVVYSFDVLRRADGIFVWRSELAVLDRWYNPNWLSAHLNPRRVDGFWQDSLSAIDVVGDVIGSTIAIDRVAIWSDGFFGFGPPSSIDATIYDQLTRLLDSFLLQYLRANPRE